MRCGAVCAVFLLLNCIPHCTMRCGVVRCIVTCGAVRLYYFAGGFGVVFAVWWTPLSWTVHGYTVNAKSQHLQLKKKKKKLKMQVQNANHPDPNATLGLNFLSARSLQLKWMKEGRKGSVIIVMRSGSLNINNRRATNSLKTFARFSPRRNYWCITSRDRSYYCKARGNSGCNRN